MAKVGRTVVAVQGEGKEEGNNFSSILESDYSSQRSRIAQIARNGKSLVCTCCICTSISLRHVANKYSHSRGENIAKGKIGFYF